MRRKEEGAVREGSRTKLGREVDGAAERIKSCPRGRENRFDLVQPWWAKCSVCDLVMRCPPSGSRFDVGCCRLALRTERCGLVLYEDRGGLVLL